MTTSQPHDSHSGEPASQHPARVVETGFDALGSSTLVRDDVVDARQLPTGRLLVDLWQTEQLLTIDEAAGLSAGHGLFPDLNGARFWQLVIPPDDPSSLPAFHATDTVDFGFVLRGAVTLELADGTAARLTEGQAFVQRGASHRWLNPSSEFAVLGVLIIGTGG